MLKQKCLERLEKLASQNAIKRDKITLYKERIEKELKIFSEFEMDEFLSDFVEIMESANLTYLAEFQAVSNTPSSAVFWALGLTPLDPIKCGFMFERFINNEKITIDFCSSQNALESFAAVFSRRKKYAEIKIGWRNIGFGIKFLCGKTSVLRGKTRVSVKITTHKIMKNDDKWRWWGEFSGFLGFKKWCELVLNLAVPREIFQKMLTNPDYDELGEGFKDFINQVKPENFSDFATIFALFHPSPLAYGVSDDFISAKSTRQNTAPELVKSLLNETYGVIIYVEQVLEILNKIGNFSLEKAILVRQSAFREDFQTTQIGENFKREFLQNCAHLGDLGREI